MRQFFRWARTWILVPVLLSGSQSFAEGLVRGWGDYSDEGLESGQTNFIKIDAANQHVVGLTSGGTVDVWGATQTRFPAVPNGLDGIKDVAAGYYSCLLLRSNGTLMELGEFAAEMPSDLSNVVSMAAGHRHALALRQDQTIVTWGDPSDTWGVLATPDGLTNIVAVSAGQAFSAAVRANGTVVGWGNRSYYGFDQIEAQLTNIVAMDLGPFGHGLALTAEGTVVAFGVNDHGQAEVPLGLSNVVAVAAGAQHSVALDQNGRVVAWGRNESGEGVPPDQVRIASWVAAGKATTLAITQAPFVQDWPNDGEYQQFAYIGAGSEFMLSPSVTSPADFESFWYKDGVILPGETNQTIHFENIQFQGTGSYSMVASNQFGWHESEPFHIQVYDTAPTWHTPPTHAASLPGTSGVLEGIAQGSEPLYFQWRKNGEEISGATNSTLTFDTLLESDAGSYQLVVSNAFGVLVSKPVQLATTLPVVVSPNYTHRQVRTGWTETLAVEVISPSPAGYQWYHNGNPVPNGGSPELVLQGVDENDTGTYTLKAGNSFGDILAATIEVVLLPDSIAPSDPGIVVPWGKTLEPPAGLTNATAIATGAGLHLALTSKGSVRAWGYNVDPLFHVIPEAASSNVVEIAASDRLFAALTRDGTIVTWADFVSPSIYTNTDAITIALGGYSVVAATRDGQVIQYPNPEQAPVGLSNVVDVASSGFYHYALLGNGTVMSWRMASGQLVEQVEWMTNIRKFNAALGLRWDGVVVLDEDQVDDSISNLVDVAREGAYVLDQEGLVFAFNNPFINPPPPQGLVALAVSGFADYAAAITSHPFPVVHPTSQTVYSEQRVELEVKARSATPLLHQWLFDGSPLPGETNSILRIDDVRQRHAGTYRVRLMNDTAEVVTDSAELTVLGLPEILAQSGSQTPGAGEPLTLFAEVASNPPAQIQWYLDGAPILHATNAQLQYASVQSDAAGVYRMRAANSFGEVWADDIPVAVLEQPPVILELKDATVGDGSTVQFVPTLVGSAPLGFSWTFGGSTEILSNDPRLQIENVQDEDNGLYTLTVSNLFGSASATAVLSTTNQSPKVIPAIAWQMAWEGDSVVMEARIEGTEPMQFQWFQNGEPVPGATNRTLPVSAMAGRHEYSLTATNSMGGTESPPALLLVRDRPIAGVLVTWRFFDAMVGTNLVSDAAQGNRHWVALNTNKTVIGGGDNWLNQAQPPFGLADIIEVEAGSDFSIALSATGRLEVWGNQSHWTLPLDVPDRVISVAAGHAHAAFLTDTGDVICWGSSEYTGVPPEATNIIQIAAGEFHTLALREDGQVFAWGPWFAPVLIPSDVTNVVSIAAGSDVNAAVADDGRFLTWGSFQQRPEGLPEPVMFGTWGQTIFEISQDLKLNIWGSGGVRLPPEWLSKASVVDFHGSAGLAITPQPMVDSLSPLQVLIGEGEEVILAIKALGTPELTVQWLHDGENIDGAGGVELRLESVSPEQSGVYVAQVSNPYATALSSEFFITLGMAPTILDSPSGRLVLRGSDVDLEVVAEGTPPLAYQWMVNSTNLYGATNRVLALNDVSWLDQGAFQVSVSNAFGESISAPANLLVSRPASEPSKLLSPVFQSGMLHIEALIQPVRDYRLQSSPNLLFWTDLQVVLSSDASTEIVIPVGEGPARYFRLISP